MIKKKYFLLLSTLLLTALLGLSGTCYARTLSEQEIRNLFINFYKAKINTVVPTNVLNNINSADFSAWAGYTSSYEGKYIIAAEYPNNNSSYLGLTLWFYTADNDRAYRYNQNGLYVVSSNNTRWRQTYYVSNNTFQSWSQGGNMSYVWNNSYYWYTDTNIWNQSSGGSVYTNAGYGYPSSDIFYENETPPPTSYFSIDINADFRDNKATISNDTSGTEYYLIPYSSSRIRIGNMFDYSNLAGIVKRKFRYKQATRTFELVQEFQSDTNNLNYYSIADDTLVVYEYYQPDTTEFITFIPKEDTDFSQFTIPIYYVTDNTRIVSGVIDTGITFSGDYYNNYNNDTNTEKVIDNVNNNNEVDSILDENLSGDIEQVANKLGFTPLDNPFTTFLLFVVEGVYDILTERGNVVLTANYKNYLNFTLESDDFITPNSTLKTFVRDMLICVYIYGNYKYFHYLITLLETARINKFMAEIGTDEFYDTDVM